MAKLSARNRTELWRLERTKAISYPPDSEPHNYDVVQETKRYAAMSDGHLLFNLVCVRRDGMRHNYGWKQKTDRTGKVMKYTPEQFSEVKDKLIGINFERIY